jgi:hypothetical protein
MYALPATPAVIYHMGDYQPPISFVPNDQVVEPNVILVPQDEVSTPVIVSQEPNVIVENNGFRDRGFFRGGHRGLLGGIGHLLR